MSRDPDADHGRDAATTVAIPVPATDPGLFGNKAVDDLLAFLVRNPGAAFGVRELAGEIGHSRSTVSRAVDQLVDNGVLEEERGTRRLVAVDDDRVSIPDDPILAVPQPAFRAPVRAVVDALTAELSGVVAVIVHGHVARGTAEPGDDVRLLVLVDGRTSAARERAARLAADLSARRFDGTRYPVDVAVEDVDSVAERDAALLEILLDGVVLHRTPAFEAARERSGTGDRTARDEGGDGGGT